MSAEIVLGECPECGTHIVAPPACEDGTLVKCPTCCSSLEVRIDVELVRVHEDLDHEIDKDLEQERRRFS